MKERVSVFLIWVFLQILDYCFFIYLFSFRTDFVGKYKFYRNDHLKEENDVNL